jgi:YD repeat-containing protein
MKKSLKLFTLLAFGAGIVGLHSCTTETPDDPTPAEIKCYLTQEVSIEDSVTTTTNYTWDANDNLTTAVVNSDGFIDTTVFEYTGNVLNTAVSGDETSTFVYAATGELQRINNSIDGVDDSYELFTTVGGNITKIEFHNLDSGDVVETVMYLTYDADGNVTAASVDFYDEDTDMYFTLADGSNFTNDGKNNPFALSYALLFMNIDDPYIFGNSNMSTATLTVFGQTGTLTSSYTYNDNDYPLTMEIQQDGSTSESVTCTYNCK